MLPCTEGSPAHLCTSFSVCCAQGSPLSSSARCTCSTESRANTSLMSGSCTSRSVCWGGCSLACKATCQILSLCWDLVPAWGPSHEEGSSMGPVRPCTLKLILQGIAPMLAQLLESECWRCVHMEHLAKHAAVCPGIGLCIQCSHRLQHAGDAAATPRPEHVQHGGVRGSPAPRTASSSCTALHLLRLLPCHCHTGAGG